MKKLINKASFTKHAKIVLETLEEEELMRRYPLLMKRIMKLETDYYNHIKEEHIGYKV